MNEIPKKKIEMMEPEEYKRRQQAKKKPPVIVQSSGSNFVVPPVEASNQEKLPPLWINPNSTPTHYRQEEEGCFWGALILSGLVVAYLIVVFLLAGG